MVFFRKQGQIHYEKYPFKSFPDAPVGTPKGAHEISRLEFLEDTRLCFEFVKNVQLKKRGKILAAETNARRAYPSSVTFAVCIIVLSNSTDLDDSMPNQQHPKQLPTQIFRRSCSMSVESPRVMHSTASFSAFEDAVHFKQLQQSQRHQGTVLKDWMLASHHLKGLASYNHNSMPPPSSPPPPPPKTTLTSTLAKVVSPIDDSVASSQETKIAPPPVAEIRIPIPETIASNSDDDDFETLYLCSRRDLHLARRENDALAEENRLLKRQMIELQKQLYTIRRSSHKRNVSWSIPSPKRSRPCNPQSSG